MRCFLRVVFCEEHLISPVEKLCALQLACYAQASECGMCCLHQLASIHVLQAAALRLLYWSTCRVQQSSFQVSRLITYCTT